MPVPRNNRKWFFILATAASTTFLIIFYNRTNFDDTPIVFLERCPKNRTGLTTNEIEKLSVLGRILYLDEPPPQMSHENYQILVWKYGKTIENRHLKHYGETYINPFEDCSVDNCDITYSDDDLQTADIVIFHLHRMKIDDLPKRPDRKTQIWAFLTDESPNHTFMTKNDLSNYNGVFNWSMTYRMDSDIPVPYGRTVPRRRPYRQNSIVKRRDVLVAILGSNCGGKNNRWDYVKELQKYIQVDIYGGCGPLKCPGHFKLDCPSLDSYLFYLAFENSNCDEYLTEKLWWNGFEKQSIPIVMGASTESYAKLLPPNSYLNVDDFTRPKDLAAQVLYLNRTEKYRDFYNWTDNFEVLNEHGYFQSQSYHYCRVCEALNYNQKKVKIYQDLKKFWSVERDCHPAWNA